MASINNIAIKGLKTFKDHEGVDIYQGNIYYKNKNLGHWSQDLWGGPDDFSFDTKILDEEVKRIKNNPSFVDKGIKEYGPMYKNILDLSTIIYEIIKMMDDERMLKKAIKSGYEGIVKIYGGSIVSYIYIPKTENWEERYKEPIDNARNSIENSSSRNKGSKIEMFNSLEQFNLQY